MEVGGTVERVVVLVGLPWRPALRISGVVIHMYLHFGPVWQQINARPTAGCWVTGGNAREWVKPHQPVWNAD